MEFKMKALTVHFLAFAAASGFLIKVPPNSESSRPASSGWWHLQKLILPLFEDVCETSEDPTIVRLAQEFTLDPSSSALYLKPNVLENLQDYISTTGLLAKGEIFTEYNDNNLKELKLIFDLLYSAKDFTTFYKAAAWARQNLNCGVFVDVIYFAILNRRDTENLALPPPYEVLPNYFIKKSFIYKASEILSGTKVPTDETIRTDGSYYIIDANLTTEVSSYQDESPLSYFREDIGLNSFYFLTKIKKYPWLPNNSDTENRHGDYVYHMIRQLSARYSLEKYIHGLPDEDDIELASIIVPDYDPMLTYSNGEEFGQRKAVTNLSAYYDLLESLQERTSVLKSSKPSGKSKAKVMNYLMEILLTGDKNFEVELRNLITNASEKRVPSVLDHYMTTIRDPLFWKICKLIVNITNDALEQIPPYTRNELFFPGLELVSIDVKKLTTYFDYFQVDVTDALRSLNSTTLRVKIGQERLNHKPFSVKLNITSMTNTQGIIKIFLGPKTPPNELVAYKDKFILLDSFECTLKKGNNVISRSLDETNNLSDDFTPMKTLRKNIEDAEFGFDVPPPKGIESMLGFPSRLIIPRGTEAGVTLQIFAIVVPLITMGPSLRSLPYNAEFNSEVLSPNFPFDLSISDSSLIGLPNVLKKEVIVTHKGDKTTSYGTSQDDGKKKQPYDYQSKKAQYGTQKVSDYNAKNIDYTTYEKEEIYTPTDRIAPEFDGAYIGVGSISFDEGSKLKQRPLLTFSGQDNGKKREPFDYKSKKSQTEKKNNDISSNNIDVSKYYNEEIRPITDTNESSYLLPEVYLTKDPYGKEKYKVENKEIGFGKVIDVPVKVYTNFNKDVSSAVSKNIVMDKNMSFQKNKDISIPSSFTNVEKDGSTSGDKNMIDKDITIHKAMDARIPMNFTDTQNRDYDKSADEKFMGKNIIIVHKDTDYQNLDIDKDIGFAVHNDDEIETDHRIKLYGIKKDMFGKPYAQTDLEDFENNYHEEPRAQIAKKLSVYDFLVHPYSDYEVNIYE